MADKPLGLVQVIWATAESLQVLGTSSKWSFQGLSFHNSEVEIEVRREKDLN